MRLIILLAITTTACAFYILHPLMRSKHAKMNEIGTFLLFLLPIAAISLYLALGNPDISSKPALFETKGPRYEYRMMIKQEMDIMQDLAHNPADRNIMIALGTLRLQTARPDEAIDILQIAHERFPKDDLVKEELGAAHYAAALTDLRDPEMNAQKQNKIENHFKEALRFTPPKALFRATLESDYERFTQMQNQ